MKERKIHRWWNEMYAHSQHCYTVCGLGDIHQEFITRVDKDATCGNCLRIMATPWWAREGKKFAS